MTDLTALPPVDNITLATKYVEVQEKLRTLKELEQTLRKYLLHQMQETGVLSFETKDFTVSQATRTTLAIHDHKRVAAVLERNGIPVSWETVLDQPTQQVAKTFAKKHQKLDGATVTESSYLVIRKANKTQTNQTKGQA